MATNKDTKVMLEAYEDMAPTPYFLLGFTKPVFHNQEKVSWDVERDGQVIAPGISIAAGVNMNVSDIYSNKEIAPVLYNEGFQITPWELMGRDLGQDAFENNDFQKKAALRMMKGGSKVHKKVLRALNVQMSQILTTAKLSVKGTDGNEIYAVDYKPKASHFFNAGTAWSNTAANIYGDLETLCDLINVDGKLAPDMVIMGAKSFSGFMNNAALKEKFNFRRANEVEIFPLAKSGGANRRGWIDIGSYKLEIWTYDATYQLVEGGTSYKYIPDAKVVVMSSKSVFKATYGSIPKIVGPDPRIKFVPGRMSSASAQFDATFSAWVAADGSSINASVGTRGLIVPVSIDTFGCISTLV